MKKNVKQLLYISALLMIATMIVTFADVYFYVQTEHIYYSWSSSVTACNNAIIHYYVNNGMIYSAFIYNGEYSNFTSHGYKNLANAGSYICDGNEVHLVWGYYYTPVGYGVNYTRGVISDNGTIIWDEPSIVFSSKVIIHGADIAIYNSSLYVVFENYPNDVVIMKMNSFGQWEIVYTYNVPSIYNDNFGVSIVSYSTGFVVLAKDNDGNLWYGGYDESLGWRPFTMIGSVGVFSVASYEDAVYISYVTTSGEFHIMKLINFDVVYDDVIATGISYGIVEVLANGTPVTIYHYNGSIYINGKPYYDYDINSLSGTKQPVSSPVFLFTTGAGPYNVLVVHEVSIVSSQPPSESTTTSYTWSAPPLPSISITFSQPGVMISSPGISNPLSILSLFMFIAIFIVYVKIARVGQALAVSAAVSLMIAMISQNPYLIVLYTLLFAVGIAMWKVLR